MNIDNSNLMCHMDAEHIKWHGKKGGAWHVIVYSELWWEDPKREANVEFYAIFEVCSLHDQLAENITCLTKNWMSLQLQIHQKRQMEIQVMRKKMMTNY